MSKQLDIEFPEGNSLPPGWAEAKLVSLVADEPNAMTDGPFGSKLKSAHYTEAGVRVIRLGNLGVGEFKDKDRSFVSEEHAATLSKHSVEAGDLLIAALAEPVGRCCRVPPKVLPAIVKADCIRFKPHPELVPSFLMHWLNSPEGRKIAEGHAHGVGRLRINMKNMRGLPVRIAPLPEQRRIVAEIETQFTRLDAAVSTLERVQANLKRARASVLKAAVEGRLVPTEAEVARAGGRAYEPASVLLERILEERRRKHDEAQVGAKRKKKYKPPVEPETGELPELPEGWAWTSVDQMTGFVTSGSRGWAKYYADAGRIFIRSQDINTYRLDLSNVAFVDLPVGVEGTRTRVQQGDVLIIITGANVTITAWVKDELSEAYVNQHVALCRPVDPATSPALHLWLMALGGGRPQLEAAAYGAGKPGLNLTNIKEVSVAMPPTAEQLRIVAEVERRLSVLDALEDTVERNLLRCTALRQSILKRAFEGKLVPQDPNDEHASELLARIGAAS